MEEERKLRETREGGERREEGTEVNEREVWGRGSERKEQKRGRGRSEEGEKKEGDTYKEGRK